MLWVSVYLNHVMRIPVFGSFDQGRHEPSCTDTEDGYRLEILDLGSRGTDLRLCFRMCKKQVFC